MLDVTHIRRDALKDNISEVRQEDIFYSLANVGCVFLLP